MNLNKIQEHIKHFYQISQHMIWLITFVKILKDLRIKKILVQKELHQELMRIQNMLIITVHKEDNYEK